MAGNRELASVLISMCTIPIDVSRVTYRQMRSEFDVPLYEPCDIKLN